MNLKKEIQKIRKRKMKEEPKPKSRKQKKKKTKKETHPYVPSPICSNFSKQSTLLDPQTGDSVTFSCPAAAIAIPPLFFENFPINFPIPSPIFLPNQTVSSTALQIEIELREPPLQLRSVDSILFLFHSTHTTSSVRKSDKNESNQPKRKVNN